jgi:hypothetical protein
VGGDITATFRIFGAFGSQARSVAVREWEGPVGRWYTPLKDARLFREVYVPPMRGQTWTQDAIQADLVVGIDPVTGTVQGIDQIRPGYIKRDPIAWVGTHRHAPGGNQPYIPTYLFAYVLDLPSGAHTVQLPRDDRMWILAITVACQPSRLRPSGALYAADLPEPMVAVSNPTGGKRR